jgi:hypothetical protein
MSKAEKERKSVAWPHNCFQERPLEEITKNSFEAEGIVIPASFFV